MKKNNGDMPASSPSGGVRGGRTPIRNRAKFFEHVQQGLQEYFDRHDNKFHGIVYFAVGVKCGQVRAVIRRDSPMSFAPKEHLGDGLYVASPSPSKGGVTRRSPQNVDQQKKNKKYGQ